MIKRTFAEVALLVGLGAGLGLVYNAAFSVKPLPWIRQPRVVDTASTDSLLRILSQHRRDTVTRADANRLPLRDTAPHSHQAPSAQTMPLAKSTEPRLPPQNDATPPPAPENVRAVTYKQVLMMLRNEEVMFLDARRKDEFDAGHIPRAQNVDIQQFELDPMYRNQVMQMLYSLDKSRPVVTYCGGGNCELSHKLSELLRSVGFEHVFIYLGGWNEYITKPDAPREQ
ncbi:MAG: hypothetical protein KatS3mg039_1168 [Candidatus Kapaibacterium sp.]|nr:MAG: hypothetical protein KatS3mg039_1168 [Candidatus Kapabacteria bacterium]